MFVNYCCMQSDSVHIWTETWLFSHTYTSIYKGGFPSSTSGKELAFQRRGKRCGFDPRAGKIPWSRKWQPTTVFLPGESYGQRSLVGYSLWGCKESDRTEVTYHTHVHIYVYKILFDILFHCGLSLYFFVLYSGTLSIHPINNNLHLLIPTSHCIPLS